ncbi:hypothetical protein AB1Y20_005085 [Prymnesium parvum]|uniref:NADH dehydrogenase [ubiquinone] 1 beta subcomplex subunit 9 n=1 Tax=Prymnesium parvum TaxID=97485 RepID=A0AB34J5I7_PRYPA|mmetsp:Transcript_15369/g.32467  ORF Transcript_15369/g.32467 Transcript_15369/m.32467 type:complete len:107 (-) Transcript_15369:551-871(-)
MPSAHSLRVARLYRRALKDLMDWTVYRDLFIHEAHKLRARFDAHKHVTNATLIEKLVSEGEKEYEEGKHPAPYKAPMNPGGSKYMRYPNNGKGHTPEVCAIPPWIQ